MPSAPPKHRRRRQPLAPALPLLLALPLLSGCLTTALWGGSIEDEDHDGVSEVALRPRADGAGDLLLKIVLTPIAVAADICTSPIQAWLYGWEDDDGDGDFSIPFD